MLGNGNCFTVSNEIIDPIRHPILNGLTTSLTLFLKKYYVCNNNFGHAFLLNNPLISRSRQDTGKLDVRFFTQQPPMELEKFSLIKVSDLVNNNVPISLDAFNTKHDLNLNLLTYMRIMEALFLFVRNIKVVPTTDSNCSSVLKFLAKKPRGSRHIRRIFESHRAHKHPIHNITIVKTFFRLTGLTKPDNQLLAKLLSHWNFQFLPNRLREFIYKYFGNSLGINVRISHFIDVPDRKCTFCRLTSDNTNYEETFTHLFFHCPTTRHLQTSFLNKYFPEVSRDLTEQKKFFFTMSFLNNNKRCFNYFVSTAILVFQFLIWEFKLKKRKPSFLTLEIEFFHNFDKIYTVSGLLKNVQNDYNFELCRNFDVYRRG